MYKPKLNIFKFYKPWKNSLLISIKLNPVIVPTIRLKTKNNIPNPIIETTIKNADRTKVIINSLIFSNIKLLYKNETVLVRDACTSQV